MAAAGVALFACSCGRYGDFRLPPPQSGPEAGYEWRVRPEPVITRGDPGAWDSVDALNPSVVRFQNRLFNFYSGFDGSTWHTGAAVSDDGLSWTKLGRVLTPDASTWEGSYIAANGDALVSRGAILYWYQAGSPPRIGLARSDDGRAWTKHPQPVVERGPAGSWDERGVGDPDVIEVAGRFYMFYLGADRAGRQRLGVARSDDGVTWTKLRGNPILDLGPDGSFDENGLGEPALWAAGGYYWMLYTGRDRHEVRRIGLARSRDGVVWERSNAIPTLRGTLSWNDQVVCDPSVEVTPEGVRVWFGAGNIARPDERLNGVIGYAELAPAGAAH
jgi:predicted GH43/DUF377 family glycosyl hydrolase